MKTHKAIRIAARILFILLVLVLLLLIAGDFAVNRYINADERRDLAKFLPINGSATFDRASIHPFRDFPHLSLRLENLIVQDSLANEHQLKPLMLEQLDVRVSVADWRKRELAIESVELDGLTVTLYDRADGYSNVKQLIRKKIDNNKSENKDPGISIHYNNTDLHISNLTLTKIDELKGQHARASADKIQVKNTVVDSNYDITLEIDNSRLSDLSIGAMANQAFNIDKSIATVRFDQSFSELTVNELQLKNGFIKLHNDSLGQSNFVGLFGSTQGKSNSDNPNSNTMDVAIDGAAIDVSNIDFSLIDNPKNKHLAARIIKLETAIHADADTTALVDLQLDIDQLAFNSKKGAYLRDSRVAGQVQLNYTHDLIALSSPQLHINDEPFTIKANIYTDKKTPTRLLVEKENATTQAISPLLTHRIQKSISDYAIAGPFYAKAQVLFSPGKKDPRVEVDFQVDNKTVRVKGQTIEKARLSATFVNRLYDDARQYTEGKRNARVKIHRIQGLYNDLSINSRDAVITSSPEQGDRILAQANITGEASSVSKLLAHDNFQFQAGEFSLAANVNGSLNNIDDLLAGTNLNLAMDGLDVYYPAGNTILPLRILEIKKQGQKTLFEIEGFTDKYQRPFRIQGEIDRIESLLFPDQRSAMQTEAAIRASSISWEGLIALFGKDGILSKTRNDSTRQAKRSMKQTLSGIQQSFHPIVRVNIDTVFYGKDIQLINFNTGLKFNDERTLVLEETSFNIDKSTVSLDGEVIINQLDFTRFDFDIELNNLDFDALMPKFDYFGIHLIKQIHDQPDNLSMKVELSGELDDKAGLRPESIDAYITYESFATDKFSGSVTLKANPSTKKVDVIFGHSGHPRNFNHLLESDAYRFDKGWFTASFQFSDNFESVAQMVEESKFGLTISDAEVYITELDITVPLSRIEVASIDNKAFYYLLLRSDSLDQEVAFDGVVKNIRHFAFKDTDEDYEVDLQISSPRIIWDHLKGLIEYKNQNQTTEKSGKALKESISKVLSDFNPDVKLAVDRLEYSDKLHFEDIFAHAYLNGQLLKIDRANVAYGQSRVEANIDLDMAHENILPFDLHLELSNIDIGQTLEHFDYFDVDELREAKQIDGNIWFQLDMNAEMDLVNQGFNSDKTRADIAVRLVDVVIDDLHTIDTVAIRIGKEKRFDVLRFAPIESHIQVRGQRIEVEETEIQSNALHAFVEGTIDKNSKENLWISIPIRNLKKPDLETIPEKTGYAGSGRKVFLQWVSSTDEKDGKMKIRLRKKKFFQERDSGKAFRMYKKENRKERRRLRQQLKG